MVIRNEEPDIAVGGGPTIPPVATAVPATAFASDPNKNIERTTNSDGSLMVKVTTTAPQTNGYREVTIEYFYVPANMAGTVIMAMDATGEPPSSLYMTKMEQQVLPPGTPEVVSHAPTPVASAPVASTTAAVIVTNPGNVGRNPSPQADTTEPSNSVCNKRGRFMIWFSIFLTFVTISNVIRALERNRSDNDYDYDNDWPTYSSPFQPTACADTPGWVNSFGLGCEFYNRRLCDSGADFQGDMGAADENCCVCGGGTVSFNSSSSKAPTTSSTAVPTIVSEDEGMEVNATNDSDESI